MRTEMAQAAAGAPGCRHVCPVHVLTCVRLAHDPDADMGPGRAKGNVVPHVTQNEDGSLTQWMCSAPCPPIPAPPAPGQLAP